ncbi:hypothetical protein HOD84_09455 [bacterium]|nr:hypothetical protein [bacterium]
MNNSFYNSLLLKFSFYSYLIITIALCQESKYNGNGSALLEYSLKEIVEVKGRQGVATDGNYYVVSGSKDLYLYTIKGQLLKHNSSPFEMISDQLNHFGDIDIYKNEIYAGVENFINGKGENIQIAIYNLNSLEFIRSIPASSSSGQLEVCGVAVDEKRNLIWLADWVNGKYLYRYSLNSGDYLGRLRVDPAPTKIQGITIYRDHMLLTSDDADADYELHDHIYSLKIPDSKYAVESKLKFEKLLDDFRRAGEVEGLCISPDGSIFSVLMNRGRKIDEGIPKGFYDGYDREIHEIYIYNVKTKRDD